MKVWERINEIRGENMTLEERKRHYRSRGCVGAFLGDKQLYEIASKIAQKNCDLISDAGCIRCAEIFLNSDYIEVKK